MKYFLILCFLTLTTIGTHADEKPLKESVEQLMELTEVSKMIDSMQEQIGIMFDGISKQMNISDKERPAFENYMQKVAGLLEKDMNWESIKEPMIDIYVKHLSKEEVEGLIKFYQSDLGRSMTKKMPLIMNDSMLVSQELMKGFMPKIQTLALELQQEIQKSRQETSTPTM